MRTHLLSSLVGLALVLAAGVGCRSTAAGARIDDLTAARGKNVVYAGEFHDDLAHHAHQLELLRAVVESAQADGVPALFGLEMFQRPFQRHLDDYVAGRIDEREMLRRTEYFTRWSYDHTMYAPMWRFCRENGVRVVALNAEKSLTRQIGREGIDSLTPEQRAGIAAEIVLDDPGHRARLMPFFQSDAHPMPEERVESMYQAMTVWDETMAESAVIALQEAGPGARMLVIAGAMHIQEFNGIPDRVTRRMPDSTRLVVVMRTEGREDSDGDKTEAQLGDVVVRLAPVAGDPPSRLGVQLGKEPRPEGFVIESVVDGGNAARAGIRAGDVLKAIGCMPITDMTDLRWTLDLTPIGTTVPVRVMRADRPVVVDVTFHPPLPPGHPKL